MSAPVTLLVEIGCEEIPARMLPGAGRDLADLVTTILDKAGLAHGPAQPFWPPRRLAVRVPGTAPRAAERRELLLGPPAAAAWDAAGAPGKALVGFATKQGIPVERFTKHETPKGVYAAADVVRGGESVGDVLAAALPGAVAKMSFPKTMRWGGGEHTFVRPVHWVVALAGSEVLPLTLFGVAAGRATRGHRTLGPGPFEVPDADAWEGVLDKAGVVADPETRRARLDAALRDAAAAHGGRCVEDPELLQEVADMVEYPGALCGTFQERYVREVPAEILETCLRHHQKAFLVVGEKGPLPVFAVSVNVPADPEGHVRRGHEWVAESRLADALLFWNLDRKERLEARIPALEGVVFQKELGTYGAKSRRVTRFAGDCAAALALSSAERADLLRAAELARCDLVSGLVGEFPELQGIAGGLLARADGEPAGAADAVYDVYRPSGADDGLPKTFVGRLLGLLDRLDTLAGGFAVGLAPSGSRDPFALRRAGIGVVRLAAAEPRLALVPAVWGAMSLFDGKDGPDLLAKGDETRKALLDFLFERFAALAEKDGARYDEVASVRPVALETGFRAADLLERLAALREFRTSDDFLALAAASKRVGNILDQAETRGEPTRPDQEAGALALPAELALAEAVKGTAGTTEALLAARDYRGALAAIAALRGPVDRFFDDVLVMDPDARVRHARLGLLAGIRRLARAVVDISLIVVEGAEKN